MKLYTLGTSHGSAEIERSCSVNVIETGGNFYIFDCGGNIEEKFVNMGLPFTSIKAVFISHMHRDHIQSIPAVLHRVERETRLSQLPFPTVDIFMPEENGISALKNWIDSMHMDKASKVAKYTLLKEGVVFKDDFITVTAISTKHINCGQYPTFSYMVEAEGKSFIYTGDLWETFEDYPNIIFEKEFDCVLCELVHFNLKNNLNTIIKSRTKKMIFTHVRLSNIPLIEACEDKFPFEVIISYDGMCYEI